VSRPTASLAAPARPEIDAASVVERATHVASPVAGHPGAIEVRDPSYVSRFDASGFRYAPTGATGSVGLSLTSLARGGHALPLDVGAWSGTENVVERPASAGVTERVTARTGEVEWDVVLASPPAGRGDLVVDARLDGFAGPPVRVQTADGLAWRLGSDPDHSVVLDEVVVRDATGAVLHRALPTVTGNRIELVVPDRALVGAAYPVVVDPTVSAPTTVRGAGNRSLPSVGFDGTNFLVVWQEPVSGAGTEVVAARVNGNNELTSGPMRVSFSGGVNAVNPDIAWNGNDYLVVWEKQVSATNPDIKGQRLSSSGGFINGEINISSNTSVQRAPAVSAGGSTWLVVWHDCRNGNCDIFGGTVNSAGSPLNGAGFPVSTDTHNEFVPDVAWNGTRWLVTWEYQFSAGDDDILAAQVTTNAGIIGSFIVANPGGHQRHPAVASDGSAYLVAWDDDRSGGVDDIYGNRVNATGVVQDSFTGFPISTAGDSQSDPAVAYNGSYLVAWRDRRLPPDPDVYAARVGSNGIVQDPSGFAISATASDEGNPAVGPAPAGKWAVGYELGDPGSTSIIQRIASK
jgi:hypothetical protein